MNSYHYLIGNLTLWLSSLWISSPLSRLKNAFSGDPSDTPLDLAKKDLVFTIGFWAFTGVVGLLWPDTIAVFYMLTVCTAFVVFLYWFMDVLKDPTE